MIYVLYSVVTVRHLRMHPGLANPDDPVLGTLPLVSRPGEGMGDGYAPLLYIHTKHPLRPRTYSRPLDTFTENRRGARSP